MGKFHYVNRKSDGLKLGQVIAKDLLKRIPPGANHKAALRDPSIDLDVSGRSLTDEGLKEVAEALITSIAYEDEHGRVVKLEEACLKGNAITAQSLRRLGKVVASAASDLKDLDLSNNCISISTSEDAAAWEDFLRSFANSCVMRRVDLSGNALGPKAFEVLAKIYGVEVSNGQQATRDPGLSSPRTPITPGLPTNGMEGLMQVTRNMTISSDLDQRLAGSGSLAGKNINERNGSMQGSIPRNSSYTKVVDRSQRSAATKGLRSIAYLVFSDTAMTDTGALHLSYIIPSHQTPDVLLPRVPPAKAGPPSHQLELYDATSGCRGIIYKPNTSLGSAGTRLLELAEVIRGSPTHHAAAQSPTPESRTLSSPPGSSRRASEARIPPSPYPSTPSTSNPGRRRSTVTASSDAAGPEEHTQRLGELHRARSRIQGDTLRDFGPQSNDLWHASLKMLSLARTILLCPKEPSQRSSFRETSNGPGSPLPAYLRKAVPGSPIPKIPLASANTNQAMFPRLPHRRKNSLVPSALAMTPLNYPPPSPRTPFSTFGPGTPYRTSLPGGLSEEIWGDVIALAAGAVGVVNETQRRAIARWAMDRGTLGREMDTLGKAGSAQIWKVLEGMGCLAYEGGL